MYARDLQIARLTGTPVETVRINGGLARQFIPARIPGAVACRECGRQHPTLADARRCASLDAGTTD